MNCKLTFILLAAGSGQRFGYSQNKLLYPYNGQPLFNYLWQRLVTFANDITVSPERFNAKLQNILPNLADLVCLAQRDKYSQFIRLIDIENYRVNFLLVCQDEDKANFKRCIKANLPKSAAVYIAEGSFNREASMLNAWQVYTNSEAELVQSPNMHAKAEAEAEAKAGAKAENAEGAAETELVFIHDAARLQISSALIERLLLTALIYDSAVPALPVTDTIVKLPDTQIFKKSNDDRHAAINPYSIPVYISSERLKRSELVALQTPQVFKASNLHSLVQALCVKGLSLADLANFTDDSSLYEAFVGPVNYVLGQADNFKLTLPNDLKQLKL